MGVVFHLVQYDSHDCTEQQVRLKQHSDPIDHTNGYNPVHFLSQIKQRVVHEIDDDFVVVDPVVQHPSYDLLI